MSNFVNIVNELTIAGVVNATIYHNKQNILTNARYNYE